MKENLKDQLKILKKYVTEGLIKVCFRCLEKTKYDFFCVLIKDNQMTKLYKVNEFKHALCGDCLNDYKIKV